MQEIKDRLSQEGITEYELKHHAKMLGKDYYKLVLPTSHIDLKFFNLYYIIETIVYDDGKLYLIIYKKD